MRRLLLTLCLLAVPALVQAQTQVVPTATHLGWDQPNQTPAVANGFTYNAYVDAAAPVVLTGLTCATGTPTTTAACVANWPTMTPGVHVLTLTQASGTAESAKATPALSITVVILVAPTNLRQVP